MTAYDVTADRDLYIGGSDIPIIMGISSFKTRYQLLLEKAGLAENEFQGNRYTEYGNIIEPQIRAYINSLVESPFEPNRVIKGDFRSHTDGFNGECVLEIKSTSHIYREVNEYKVYLVQLLKYMEQNEVSNGILAVYERPEDFDPVFDVSRLYLFDISLDDYADLLNEVNYELDCFRSDLARLKENPLLCEQDFQPPALIQLSREVVKFEERIAELKAIEKECEKAKQTLFEEMEKHGVKKWETPNGTKITRVDGTAATTQTVVEFDVEAFKAEHADIYSQYMREKQKKTAGRKGFVKITLPKGVANA